MIIGGFFMPIRDYFIARSSFFFYIGCISNPMLNPRITVKRTIVLSSLFFSLIFFGGFSIADAQLNIQMLIIGGGGGGGRNNSSNSSGGGGGGGGQVAYATTSAPAGSSLTVTVGAGGNGYRFSPAVTQTNGGASSITLASSTWSAVGGNAGGNATSSSSSGSGGASVTTGGYGAGGRGGIYNNGNAPSGWPASGGNGTSAYSSWGAATGTGQLSGSTYYYGGGGAGGNWGGQLGSGDAAAGLGGAGTSNANATANTGGGGGGANSNGGSGFNIPGGNGGSGLVIISYAGTPQATGGTIVQSGGFTYHTFTSSGTLVMASVLPVVWQSFSAMKENNAILLDWAVSEDLNDHRYEVERSSDGSAFQAIASVPASKSDVFEQYSYTDNHPLSGKTFYRIEQVDADGVVTYSNTISVEANSLPTIQCFPNPIHDHFSITLPGAMSGTYFCSIYNASGALVLKRGLTPGLNDIDMQAATSGVYFVELWENGVCVQVEKVINL